MKLSPIAYGCWRFAGNTVDEADRLIRTALDHGLTLIDTADIYGFGEPKGFGGAEEILGDVLKALARPARSNDARHQRRDHAAPTL